MIYSRLSGTLGFTCAVASGYSAHDAWQLLISLAVAMLALAWATQ